jgi:hypothetical protein
VLYYFVKDDNAYSDQLYELMPKEASVELVEVDQITGLEKTAGFDMYVFVFDNDDYNSIKTKATGFDAKTLGIGYQHGQFGIDGAGTVYFYEFGSVETSTSYFHTKEMLLGAVFSEDAGFYECNLYKAFNRYNMIKNLNKERLSQLADHENVSVSCRNILGAVQISFSTVSNADISQIENSLAEIEGLAGQLDNLNDDLIRKNCPLIY